MEGQSTHGKDGEKTLKNRFMGKLFKERKSITEEPNEQDVDSFLRSDKLYMMPTSNAPQLPPLTRLDTNAARRWPSATDLNNSHRPHSASPRARRGRKGLVVRFTEAQPEVIGEGGDEATLPVADIGARKRAHSPPPMSGPTQTQVQPQMQYKGPPPQYEERAREQARTDPPPLPFRPLQQRPQSEPDQDNGHIPQVSRPPVLPELETMQSNFPTSLDQDQSFATRLRAEMRSGEGKALVQAASESSPFDQHFPRSESPLPPNVETNTALVELHTNTMSNTTVAAPAPGIQNPMESRPPPIPVKVQVATPTVPILLEPGHRPPSMQEISSTPAPPYMESGLRFPPLQSGAPHVSPSPNFDSPQPEHLHTSSRPDSHPIPFVQTSSHNLQDTVNAVGEEALQDFSRRSAHLFTLFRLSAESVKPLPKCSPQELVRVALWWFLKGRTSLETSIRQRPNSVEEQQSNELFRQQAHADLAKALWIIEHVTSQYPQRQLISTGPNTPMADLLSAQQGIMSNLKKLATSMKRNNFLPPDPDDAPLPQGVDNTIWVMDDGSRSLVTSQRFVSVLSLLESFSLGDTEHHFQYGRMFVEAVLLEEASSQYYRCHVLLSILRSQQEKGLTVTVASQDGLLNLGIQHDKARGPTWEDVSWQKKGLTLDVKLPRGFVLRLHCQEQDYAGLWSLFDLHNEIYAILEPRGNEELIFDTTVKTFQQFELIAGESTPTPPLPNCYLRVFERTIAEKATSGPRTKHRGFRLGLCTNSRTKNVKGVDRTLLPNLPIQFGYLRGENGLPALLLKSSDEKSQNNIVFTFEDANQRTRLHTLLTGLALQGAEEIVAETLIKSFSVTNQRNYDSKCLEFMDWKSLKVINESYGEVKPSKTILSENLRIVLDFKAGTITDRFNLGPGELKLRSDVNSPTQLKLLRQPQQDLTISVSESQVLKELPDELADLLRIMGRYETSRTYTFADVQQLHLFQTALTGFTTLFDGMAASFNISRRRMVVPIYKKWDAASTRVQLLEKDKVVQLVAFFEDFSHGSCMSFILKSTDVFESSGRNSKFSIKIVDAKFSLPKVQDPAQPGMDHEFVALDAPEYPSEHDDITIVFDAEADRERFAQCLPAPVKHSSRMTMPSMRR